jgi:RsiW-degrading membrane proteinase PrsW (M82 family)
MMTFYLILATIFSLLVFLLFCLWEEKCKERRSLKFSFRTYLRGHFSSEAYDQLWELILQNLWQGASGRRNLREENVSRNSDRERIPYKFYTDLVHQILYFEKIYGISSRSSLQALRKAVVKEKMGDEKLRRLLWGSIFQYLLVMVVTWTFVGMTREMPVSSMIDAFLIGMHATGLCAMVGLLKRLEAHYLKPFGPILAALYGHALRLQGNVDSFQATKQSGVVLVLEKAVTFIPGLAQRLLLFIEETKIAGHFDSMLFEDLCEEVWHVRDEKMGRTQEALEVGKLLLMVVFFLMPHFTYLYQIFLTNQNLIL